MYIKTPKIDEKETKNEVFRGPGGLRRSWRWRFGITEVAFWRLGGSRDLKSDV
jgi:hypothetical protein